VVGGGVKSDVDVIALAKRGKVAEHRLETTNRAHTCEIEMIVAQEKQTSDVHGFGIGVAHEEVGIVGLELDEGTLGQRDQAHIHIVSLDDEEEEVMVCQPAAFAFGGSEGK
jgi:hypothetical protein